MIKREYVVKGDKLCYVDNDPAFPSAKEVECSKEELTALIIKQDKNKAELSDEYIGKVAAAMKEAASTPVDYRYKVAKECLSGLIAKQDGRNSIYDIEGVVEFAFKYADEFIKQGEYNK